MSVRRLAEDHVQPSGFSFTQENADWAQATIQKYPEGREQSAVIPLLMRAQEQDGWITKAAIESIADMLGMAYIRVLEVATFYTQFQLKPVGSRAHVQVCGTTPCMLRGSEDLMNVCKRKIHPEQFHLNDEGSLSWEEVECLGACVNAPMVMIFKDTFEDLTPIQLEYIIDRFNAGLPGDVRKGPQIDRIFSAPFGGPTTLKSEDKPVTFAETQAAAAKAAAAKEKADAEAAAVSSAQAAVSSTKSEPVAVASADVAVKPKSDRKAADAEAGKAAEPSAKKLSDEVTKSKSADKKSGSTGPSMEDPNRPPQMEKPEKPDDLSLLSGVGPARKKALNAIGVYNFSQIAALTGPQLVWIGDYLNVGDNPVEDEWTKQADALARGGIEEFERVFGKVPR
jgi:NADH-quinone oxidoreductase subunit E